MYITSNQRISLYEIVLVFFSQLNLLIHKYVFDFIIESFLYFAKEKVDDYQLTVFNLKINIKWRS